MPNITNQSRLLILLFALPLLLNAQEKVNYEHPIPFAPQKYVCYQSTESIKIDGTLNEESWNKAEWTSDFVDIEGQLKPNPPLRTRAKMLWDKDYFYIAAELEESHLWATLTERDAIIYQDDDFEVFIDPDGDGLHYYEFEINAFNTVWDLLMLRPYRDSVSQLPHYLFNWNLEDWKTGVNTQGSINDPSDKDQGWTVEMAIPWEALKELANPKRTPKDGEYWRVNFSRVDWHMDIKDGAYQKQKQPGTNKNKPEENWVWSPQGRISMHQPETYGYVLFSEEKVGTKTVDFPELKEEAIKWALYQLFHQQHQYLQKHRRFTSDKNKLSIPDPGIDNYEFKPVLFTTPSSFEILVPSSQRGIYWRINEEGKVWKK